MERGDKRGDEVEEVRVLVLSHCILNRATRWWQSGKPVERNRGPVGQVLEFLSAHEIGAVQLPCPEFTFLGNPRPPATKDEYEALPGFRLHCEGLAKDVARHLKALAAIGRKPKIRILAIIGVERSPSCGVSSTPRKVGGMTRYFREEGVFLEILERELEKLDLRIPFLSMDLHRRDDFCKNLSQLLE